MHRSKSLAFVVLITLFVPFKTFALDSDCFGLPCTPLTIDEKRQILELLNDLREDLANGNLAVAGMPPATDMNQLIWDDGLQNIAQAHADTCPSLVISETRHEDYLAEHQAGNTRFGPDSQSFSCNGTPCVLNGQNVFVSSSVLTLESVLGNIETDWWNEYQDWTFGRWDEGCTGTTCENFTQLAWANTRYVGCGYANGCLNINVFFCNFFPTGNFPSGIVATQPYEDGEACSNCMPDRKICSDGLCGGTTCPTIVNGATFDRATANGYFTSCLDGEKDEDLFPPTFDGGFCSQYNGCVIGGFERVEFLNEPLPPPMCFESLRTFDPVCAPPDVLYGNGFE